MGSACRCSGRLGRCSLARPGYGGPSIVPMHWWTWVFGGAGVGVPIAIVTTWLTLRKRSHETPPHLKLKQRAHGGIVAGRDIHVGGDLNFVDLSDSDVARIADTLADPLQQRQK